MHFTRCTQSTLCFTLSMAMHTIRILYYFVSLYLHLYWLSSPLDYLLLSFRFRISFCYLMIMLYVSYLFYLVLFILIVYRLHMPCSCISMATYFISFLTNVFLV